MPGSKEEPTVCTQMLEDLKNKVRYKSSWRKAIFVVTKKWHKESRTFGKGGHMTYSILTFICLDNSMNTSGRRL